MKSWRCGTIIPNQGCFHKNVCVVVVGKGGYELEKKINKMFTMLHFMIWCSENCKFIQNPTAGYWWNKDVNITLFTSSVVDFLLRHIYYLKGRSMDAGRYDNQGYWGKLYTKVRLWNGSKKQGFWSWNKLSLNNICRKLLLRPHKCGLAPLR